MITFKKIFQSKSRTIAVGKAQKEILECFLSNKAAFDNWFYFQAKTKIAFKFFYPTAIDFYFDEIKLFTAYFRKNHLDQVELQELKMSAENDRTICSPIWKPFEEVMLQFLNYLNENEKVALFQQRKSLYEYADLCKGNTSIPTSEPYPIFKEQIQ